MHPNAINPGYLNRTASEVADAADPGVHRMATAGGATIEEARNLSVIEREKAKLDGALVHIDLQVEKLGKALLLVLHPPVNVEAIKGVASDNVRMSEPSQAPFVHDLQATTARLHRLAHAIEALQQRLAL